MSRDTAIKQAKAARALRRDASQSQAAAKAGVTKRTIQRWQLDPTFAARLRHETLFTLGPLPAPNRLAPSTDPLDGLPPSKAWVSVHDRAVLASALHPSASDGITNNCDPETGRPGPFTPEIAASVVQVELVTAPERGAHVAAAVSAGRAPDPSPHAVVIPLTLAGLQHVQGHPDDLDLLIRLATDFRAFLDVWQFRAQEAGEIQILGEVLWEAQEEFVRMTAAPEGLFPLSNGDNAEPVADDVEPRRPQEEARLCGTFVVEPKRPEGTLASSALDRQTTSLCLPR
jgi:hypothetical protein